LDIGHWTLDIGRWHFIRFCAATQHVGYSDFMGLIRRSYCQPSNKIKNIARLFEYPVCLVLGRSDRLAPGSMEGGGDALIEG
jgi:hypothetical protein